MVGLTVGRVVVVEVLREDDDLLEVHLFASAASKYARGGVAPYSMFGIVIFVLVVLGYHVGEAPRATLGASGLDLFHFCVLRFLVGHEGDIAQANGGLTAIFEID